jgi:hypothetical protein
VRRLETSYFSLKRLIVQYSFLKMADSSVLLRDDKNLLLIYNIQMNSYKIL